MNRLLIREGHSPGNSHEYYDVMGSRGSRTYGDPEASLTSYGEANAVSIRRKIDEIYPEYRDLREAATSNAQYSKETAAKAGLKPHPYDLLDNPIGEKADIVKIVDSVRERKPVAEARDRIMTLLISPPSERIWIVSAYVDATICDVLGVYRNAEFIPYYGEIREVDIPE